MRVASVALLLLHSTVCAFAQNCQVKYSDSGEPLLFGGVSSRCVEGCQSREAEQPNDWGNVCALESHGSVWGVCTEEQARHSFELAKQLGGGAILNLSPCEFVRYLRGRTLWLIGDSHSKTFYRALQCFLYDFWEQKECLISTNPQDVTDILRLPAADGISNCFHLTGEGGGRVCLVHVALTTSLLNSTEVADGGVLPFLRGRLAAPQDIFYINTGTWHRKTTEWGDAYAPALNSLGQYYQATRDKWPHVLFRETPAIHPMDPARNVCTPLDAFTYNPSSGGLSIQWSRTNKSMNWYNAFALNKIVRDVLPKYHLHVVPAYNISAELYDNHIGMRNTASLDCLHYCQPGMPEAWIWYLYSAMRQGRAKIKPLPISSSTQQQLSSGQYPCAPSTLRM